MPVLVPMLPIISSFKNPALSPAIGILKNALNFRACPEMASCRWEMMKG
jgi:hypothetical protein